MQCKIIEIAEHSEPISSVQFVHDYSIFVSASKSELILWDIMIDDDPEFKNHEYKPNPEASEDEEVPSRFVVQAK